MNLAHLRDIHNCLGSRTEINQKILLEERGKRTIISTSLVRRTCNTTPLTNMQGKLDLLHIALAIKI
uniref:SFRICE_020790 n=1 Tax=Spodoptera frugiperda TaxID=7108 RepID=A0A2H1V942_SPOFR